MLSNSQRMIIFYYFTWVYNRYGHICNAVLFRVFLPGVFVCVLHKLRSCVFFFFNICSVLVFG